jgi:methionine synthase II (cobalamin-independent)
MAYAYLSTGREKVMSEDREKALALALKAVLSAARNQGLDLDELSEAAADELLNLEAYESDYLAMAINEIEVAVDALV